MKIRRKLGLGAASALLFSGSVGAVTMTSGDTATILWGGIYDGATLSASATFTLTSLSETEALFQVSVANTTAAGQPGRNRLVSFGITDIAPNITGAEALNNGVGDQWTAVIDTTFPGFQTVELCIWAGRNCAGGGTGGLVEGESDSFQLRLIGSFADVISLGDPFPSKWQSVGNTGQSVEFGGCTEGRCGSGSSVPEPGPLALFALGLVGLSLRKRTKFQ